MATDLDHVRAHTRLLLKALEWEGRGQDKSLLLRGGELKRSEEWLATSRDRDPGHPPNGGVLCWLAVRRRRCGNASP